MTEEALGQVRLYINRALAGVNTLHLGPLDYNISTTIDDLLAAQRLLEQIKQGGMRC